MRIPILAAIIVYKSNIKERNKKEWNEYMKEWVRKNPEKAKANKRMTYIRYREKIIEGNKKWLKKNYKKNLEYRVAWERNKRKTNPQHRLNINFARAICHCLGSKKEWRK